MISPIFLILLVPIAGYVILRSENINLDRKKLYAGFFILLLVAVTPAFSFQPAFADNEIKQVIKIVGLYPADVASVDFVIDPPLTSIDKTFIIFTVRHTGENDASDTIKSIEIIDVNTIRLKGEDTASGNNAVEFVAYIIEYDPSSTINVQHLQESLASSSGTQTFTIPTSVNETNSMIISRGQHLNVSATAVGNNDFLRIRIIAPTTWEVQIDTAPDIPQASLVDVVDWNQGNIFAQNGLLTMQSPSFTGEVIGGVDFTAIDPTRTMFMFTYTSDGSSGEPNDDLMIRGSLTDGGDIRFFRDDDDSELLIAWELIEFPVGFIKIKHFNSTLLNTELSIDVTVPEIRDFSKTMAMSHGGSPFGFSTGSGSNDGEVVGGIDRSQSTLLVINNTRVQISREDSTAFTEIGWQLIEFLETDEAQNAQGTNTLRQIIKVEDTYTGASSFQDYTISPSLLTVNNTILFMSIEDASLDTADVSERLKRYGIIDTSTLRVHGSNDPLSSNTQINFTAYIVEFDQSSPIFVQRDQVQYSNGITADELIMHMSPVNQSGSHIQYNAWTSTNGDDTLGQEEFARVRIINDTTWGYEVELPSDNEESVAVVNIIDWNQNNISVQMGQASLTGTTLSVSPPTDVIRNQTMLLVSHRTSNSEFEDEPDDSALFAHLDGSSPPDMVFERIDSADPSLEINWQLISFPSNFAKIQHLTHLQAIATQNDTATITSVGNFSKSIAIGTSMSPMGFTNGKSSKTLTDSFGEAHGKITLEDATTVRFERGLSTGSWEVGYQVIEFEPSVAPTIFDQDILDVVTVVDLGTQFDITKLFSDTATVSDTVSTNIVTIFNQNETDTVTILDQVATDLSTINNQTITDTVTVLDQVNSALNATESIADTVTVLDQVQSNVTTAIDVLLADTATVTDQVRFIINKTAVDISTAVDLGTGFNVSKIFADVILTVDGVDTNVATNFNTTVTDTATILDIIELGITKAIQDNVIVLDGVNTTTITQITITDIVQVQDNNLGIIITPILPPSGGGGSGGGGGTPDPEGFQRIIGLDIQSEVIEIQLSTVVPSDFEITVFGQQTTGIFITGLVTEPQFVSWFNFGDEPRELDFDVTIDQQKTSNDPTRIQNLALDDFVVNAPNIPCTLLDPFDPPQACLDPILYEVPVEFEFSKGGVTFHEDHIIIVDARVLEKSCIIFGLEYPLILCENISITTFSVVDGGTENSIPILILPVLLLALFTFIVFAFRQASKGGVRSTTRRKFRKRDELTSMSDRQVRRKFKRGR